MEPMTYGVLYSFVNPSADETRREVLSDLTFWQREMGLMAKLKDVYSENAEIYWSAHMVFLNAKIEIEKIREEMKTWR